MRKLATAAAVSLALASSGAIALGLGDIEMQSALNQPMNAEIRLTSVKPGEADGMIVQLATQEAFSRAGIERSNVLKDLRFRVDPNNGAPVIRITSNSPVVEPFLNFLLEVDWPSGRMVREYTVLLDPPVFMTPNATSRNTAADQPVLIDRNEQSMLAPAPIDRNSNAAITDTFDPNSVEIIGGIDEVADSTSLDAGESVAIDSLENGEVVDLFSVDEVGGLADSDLGDVVVLSDLDVVNTDAVDSIQTDLAAGAEDFQFDVQVMSDASEVSNTFVADDTGLIDGAVVSLDNGESELVSLDSLESVAGSSSKEVTVNRGDTLLGIARENAVAGASAQQMMIALLNANQSSFINGNVNLVKAGSILRIPEAAEIEKLSQSEALAQLSEQNQLWQEYRDQVRSNAATKVATANTATAAPAPTTESSAIESAADPDGLSAEARRIIESARNEVLNRDELKILAAGDETTTTASATADNSQTNKDASIGEINRKLQLAREELASTRLESTDLSEQSDELQSTTENLESLVNVRQNEVARLQAQLQAAEEQASLQDAKDAAKNLAANAADGAGNAGQNVADAASNATDAAGNALDSAGNAAGNALDSAGNAASNLAGDARDAASSAVAGASDALGDATDSVTGAAENAADAGSNALTAAGQELGQVELVPEAELENTAEIAPPVKQAPWYADLLAKYGKWLVAGLGAISALFLGLLLFKKRRNRDEEPLDFEDDVEFFEDDDVEVQFDSDPDQNSSGIGSAVAAGAAGAAAVGGAAMAMGSDDDENELDFGSETQAVASAVGEDGIDADDTISEVDAYLTYGLHSQAEELLNKAIDRDPNNPSYAMKLIETHHAQGNAEGFNKAAESYHEQFGEDDQWSKVCAMGQGLQPNNALYAGAAGLGAASVAANFGENAMSESLDDSDFLVDSPDDLAAGSFSRDFSADLESADDMVDETALMDQSLDPAFAFDETDLEATGDFSQIAEELAEEEGTIEFPGMDTPDVGAAVSDVTDNIAQKVENIDDDGSLDFPGFDSDGISDSLGDLGDAGKEKLSSAGSAVTGGIGAAAAGIAGGAGALLSGAGDKAAEAKDSFDDALSLDEFDIGDAANEGMENSLDGFDNAGSVAEDLTLDLDQLSGDLEMDSTSLLDDGLGDVADLEIPDLTSDNELLSSDLSDSDEMDTMMDLAKAYIDMGDKDSASSALGEIVKSGTPAQVSEAENLLRKIS